MTTVEFDAARSELLCRHCGHRGLEVERYVSNNGVRPVCPACGSKTPLLGVQWLGQGGSRLSVQHRRKGPIDERALWQAAGDHCTFCGKSWALCEQLGIGRTAQHIWPLLFGGESSPLVPFCARCQEMSRAALLETADVMECIRSLEGVIARIEARFPELKG
jgi:hypothetical protein